MTLTPSTVVEEVTKSDALGAQVCKVLTYEPVYVPRFLRPRVHFLYANKDAYGSSDWLGEDMPCGSSMIFFCVCVIMQILASKVCEGKKDSEREREKAE